MNKTWRMYADKYDALSQRERVMVFVAVVVAPAALVYALFIDPAITSQKALAVRTAQQQTELQALQIKLQMLEKTLADPDAANAARRNNTKRQIADIDATLKNLESGLVPAQRMNALLQDMLKRNTRLQLVALNTLPVTPLVERPAAADKTNGGAGAAPASSVFKHGVRITVQGSYADLHDYLAALEKLPWRMFWSRASLNAEDYPRLTLTVTIYTLSLDKAWLVV